MTTTKWALDPSHSELVFKVKHLMISTVTGQFNNFTVTAETHGHDFTNPINLQLSAEVDSIDTNNEQRDGHLKSADFFDTAAHTHLSFTATSYEGNQEAGTLYGDLTIKGITKNIGVQVEVGGIVTDPYGQVKAGFTVNGKISRKEFGLTWSAVTEAGGVVVGDEIKFNAEIQLIQQA